MNSFTLTHYLYSCRQLNYYRPLEVNL